jgi:6-phosphogluconate dehydrogenase (decarboxylating)
MGHGGQNIVEGLSAQRDGIASARRSDLKKRGAESQDAQGVAGPRPCLPVPHRLPQVEALLEGEAGLKAGAKPGLVIVDCSTSDPTSTLRIADGLAPLGVTLVDAPLGRTPKEAWEGTLDTMVGCDEATFARLKPVLDTWAGRVIHFGRTGEGHKMKLLNNFVAMAVPRCARPWRWPARSASPRGNYRQRHSRRRAVAASEPSALS